MRFEGVLSAWHPDAGYGAIRPLQGGEEVFVNLGAFPTDGDGPRLDERLSFEIVSSRDGRKQAVRVRRLKVSGEAAAWRAAPSRVSMGARGRRSAQRKRRLAWAAGAVIVVAVSGLGLRWWQSSQASAIEVPAAMRR